MITYRILHVDGTEEKFQTETRWTLERMQEGVGGFIEMVPAHFEFGIYTEGYIYANEDGKSLGLPVNPHGIKTPWGDLLRGDLLVVEGDPDNDDDDEDDE